MNENAARRRSLVCAAVWLLFVAMISTPALGAQAGHTEAREPAPEPVHIAVIGASVSAGFGTGIQLADVLDAAIESPKTVTDLSSILFFLDALGNTKEMAEALDEDPPDVVIGIDFLFWFGYGDKDTATRKASLRKGLEFLEKLECPVVVGDLPTFTPSFMLGEDLIPSDDELTALNSMIVEWATDHEHVTVYPLAALVESVRKGETVEINGAERTFKPNEIFQLDRLHVTKTGIVAVTAIVLEMLSQEGAPLADADVCLDPNLIAERMTPEEAVAPGDR